MKNRTIALSALAALALPGAAFAAKPEEPGKQGRDTAAAKQEAHKPADAGKSGDAGQSKAKGPKGKAFTLKGVGLAELPVADGKLTGALTLDPTSANKHARTLLDLSKADLRGTATETFGETGDGVKVSYVGLESTDALAATDRVKVIGKVVEGKLDIRTIKVKRASDESDDES